MLLKVIDQQYSCNSVKNRIEAFNPTETATAGEYTLTKGKAPFRFHKHFAGN